MSRLPRLSCAAALFLPLSGFASAARAADAESPPAAMPAPTESAPPAAPEGAPPADGAGTRPVVPGAAIAEETGPQRPADLSYGVAARLRWISVPAWLLNSFTKKNVPLSSWGTGLELFRRKGNFDIMVSFNYQNMSPSDGNWLGKGTSHPANLDTDYVQFDGLALYGADVSFIWHTLFNEWFGLHYGAGIGLARIPGNILRTSNNPAVCNEQNAGDVSQCNPVGSTYVPGSGLRLSPASLQPGPDDPNDPHRFADPNKPNWLPIVNVVIGVDFRLPQVRGWEAKLEGGFYDAFFLGGGVGYTF